MIREKLIERMKEMLWKRKSRVRVRRELGENFCITRGVKQKSPLSPLFNILTADLEREMEKVKLGGMKLRETRRYTVWQMIWFYWRKMNGA